VSLAVECSIFSPKPKPLEDATNGRDPHGCWVSRRVLKTEFLCFDWPMDQRPPDHILSFGKHEGRRVSAVAADDPGYIFWLASVRAGRDRGPHLWNAIKAHLAVAAESFERRDRQLSAEHQAAVERKRALVERLARRAQVADSDIA